MKTHTKIYLKHFGYSETDFIPCEVCGNIAVVIHHIECRGMGGTKQKDSIENLMALCRADHLKYGDKKQWKDWLKNIHQAKINKHGN